MASDEPDNRNFRNPRNDNAETRGYGRFLQLDESMFLNHQPDYAVAMSDKLANDPLNRAPVPSNPHPRVGPSQSWRYAGSRVWTGSEFVHATRAPPVALGGFQGTSGIDRPVQGPGGPPGGGFSSRNLPPPPDRGFPRQDPPSRGLDPRGPFAPPGRGLGPQDPLTAGRGSAAPSPFASQSFSPGPLGPSRPGRDGPRAPPQNLALPSYGPPAPQNSSASSSSFPPTSHSLPLPSQGSPPAPRKRHPKPCLPGDDWDDEAKMLLYKCKMIHKKGFASFVGRFPGHTVESLEAAWPNVKEEGRRLYEENEARETAEEEEG